MDDSSPRPPRKPATATAKGSRTVGPRKPGGKEDGTGQKLSVEQLARALRWLFCERGRLSHHQAVRRIREVGGDAYLYVNRNGNPAIAAEVLDAFKNVSSGAYNDDFLENDPDVVWSKHGHYWRLRKPSDPVGEREVP